jgi:hypothetical protein
MEFIKDGVLSWSAPMSDLTTHCPCDDGDHDGCDWWYDGCCCHDREHGDICPPTGCSCLK